jgi:hypothetical protein
MTIEDWQMLISLITIVIQVITLEPISKLNL